MVLFSHQHSIWYESVSQSRSLFYEAVILDYLDNEAQQPHGATTPSSGHSYSDHLCWTANLIYSLQFTKRLPLQFKWSFAGWYSRRRCSSWSVIILVPTCSFPVFVSRWSGSRAASHLQPHWPVRHLDLVCARGCPHCRHTHCAYCSLPRK